jgi:hypothetical protein
MGEMHTVEVARRWPSLSLSGRGAFVKPDEITANKMLADVRSVLPEVLSGTADFVPAKGRRPRRNDGPAGVT